MAGGVRPQAAWLSSPSCAFLTRPCQLAQKELRLNLTRFQVPEGVMHSMADEEFLDERIEVPFRL